MPVSPNPAGQHRRLVRTVIAQWVTSQRIRGVANVYASRPPQWLWDKFPTGSDYSCLMGVTISDDSEDFEAFTGPTNPGGMLVHYAVKLLVVHRSFTPGEQDWSDDEDDYDRIIDGLKDALRRGRDLGRPEVVLQSGTWPRQRSIVAQHDPPYATEEGPVDRWGTVSFNVSQYLP